MEVQKKLPKQLVSPSFDLTKQYAHYQNILKNAEIGKVVTRFAPEPSGYLHIGHCKSALLSYHYAQMYKGKMILRFDDTNPTKEKNQYVETITEDLKKLKIQWSILSYTSDYFDKFYVLLEDLIKKEMIYVDNTPVQVMREQRMKKIESECRNFSVQKNLEIFNLLKSGKEDQYCLRAKIDMKSNNGCLRDPVMARSSKIPHHRTGKKYSLYPTYDFACPALDSLEGVTHALRSNQYADRIPQYKWILKALNFPNIQIFQFSRLNLEHTVLSKRKLNWFVTEKKVEGWSDPRFPTVRGCLRKGIRVQTLIEFMLEQGPSKRANLMEWQKIWAINKRIIDPICPRFSAVTVEKASRIIVSNVSKEPEAVTVLQSKLHQALGQRPLWKSNQILIEFDDAESLLEVGKKVTLMNWGNFMINSKQLQKDGSYLMNADYLSEDLDFKSTKKVTWLADHSNLLIANLIEYDHLIKTPKIEENVQLEQIVNVRSCFPSLAYTDSNLRLMDVGQYLQFERRGYYIIDQVYKKDNEIHYDLILVPDGKKVGLASIKTNTDKRGDIQKKQLAQKVQQKANKEKKQKKKNENKKQQLKKEDIDQIQLKQQQKQK